MTRFREAEPLYGNFTPAGLSGKTLRRRAPDDPKRLKLIAMRDAIMNRIDADAESARSYPRELLKEVCDYRSPDNWPLLRDPQDPR